MIDHAPDELLDFYGQGLSLGQLPKLLAQGPALQRLAPVGVRRPPLRVIPRRGAPVADRLVRLAPGPQLDQRVHPGADVERPHVGPDVAHLLLHLVDLYGVKETDGILIGSAFTHADLAHMVGATRQWVTISLRRLHEKNVLVVRKSKIIVRRIDILWEMRGQDG